MKKFLIVAIICIVTASLGLLTFNFMATKEIISMEDAVFYVNVGEDFTVNYERVNPKSSTNITLSNDGFDSIVQASRTKENTFTAIGAGKAVLKLDANISGFTPITITVYVGDGSVVAPHYIDSALELNKVGTGEGYVKGDGYFKSDANYMLVDDIDLENALLEPLCQNEEGFTGKFNFADHTISNFVIKSTQTENAGLFAKIGKNGTVNKASLRNVSIDGVFSNAGALAGINNGTITNARLTSININSDTQSANIGGLVGYSTGKISSSTIEGISNETVISGVENSNVGGLVGKCETLTISNAATVKRSFAKNVKINGQNIGGLIGYMLGAELVNFYSVNNTLNAVADNGYVGGIAGVVEYQNSANNLGCSILNGYVAECHLVGNNHDNFIANSIDYNRTETTLDTANIVIGVYSIGDNTTTLVDSNYIFINNVPSITEITETTFKTKTNVKESADDTSDFRVVDFDREVWNIEEGKYPTLILDGVDSVNNILRSGNAGFVDNNIDKIKDAINDENVNKIILTKDIDGNNASVESLGDLTKDFDGAGYTIKNFRFNKAIFSQITSRIQNVTFENITVKTSDYNASILTALNEGTISNVKFKDCNIVLEQDINEYEMNIGVVASINNNYIEKIAMTNNTITVNETRKGNLNIGFISGLNNSTIVKGVIYNTNKMKIESVIDNTVYAGGVAGNNNNGTIEYFSVGYGANIAGENATSATNAIIESSSEYSNLTMGGISGYNQGAIKYNEISGTYYGYKFGGIVGENQIKNNTYTVQENTVTENTYAHGMQLGGLTGSHNQGKILNCSTFAVLDGYNNSTRIGGISVTISNKQPVTNCFIATTFSGSGEKHYGIGTSKHIHDRYDDVTKTIINTKNMGGAISNNYDDCDSWIEKIGSWVNGIVYTWDKEIKLSDEACKNLETYSKYEFDQNVWILGNNYPKLQKIENNENSLKSIIEDIKF